MPAPKLTLRLFGPLVATLGTAPVVLPGSLKARALLLYLAVEGRAVPRDELAALLWPDVEPQRARLSLRGALAQIRGALGERLDADRATVALRLLPGDAVDARDLDAGSADGASPATAAERAPEPLGAGLEAVEAPAFRAWLDAERARREDLVRRGLIRAAAHAADAGRSEAAVAALERAVELDPLHEPTVAALLLAKARSGGASAALARFEALRASLADELGVEPSAATLAVRERLVAARRRGRPRPAQSPDTPFIGRAAEVGAVLEALAASSGRVVTVVGPGGIGKTRLALETARRLAQRFLDGVHVVPLAGLASDASLAPAVAAALDLQIVGAAPALAQIEDALREREALLVLDNFETILGQAEACGRLAAAGPDVRILVTSRRPLELPGEEVVTLAGLGFPGDASAPESVDRHDAVTLFVAAARRVRADFAPEPELAAIDAICRHVEGYPLALELAAPWVADADCTTIAARLAGDLAAVPGAGGLPARHASLEAVFEHIWSELDGAARLAFARLCVFRDGFDERAAAEAAGVDAATREALIRRSLVQRTGPARFAVHEVLRRFGAARLDRTAAVAARARAAHARHFLGRFTAACRAHGPDDRAVVAFVEADADNLHAAWRHAMTGRDLGAVLPAAAELAGYYYAQGPNEAGIELADDLEAWLTEAEAADGAASPALVAVAARLVAERGFFALRLANAARAEQDAERALAMAMADTDLGDQEARRASTHRAAEAGTAATRAAAASVALRLRGILRRTAGELDAAAGDLAAAEAWARRAGDDRLAAEAAYHGAGIAVYRGDLAGCIAGTRAVLEDVAGRGYARLECALQFTLAVLLDRAGDVEAAAASSARCLEGAEAIGYHLGEMNGALTTGMLLYRRGRLAAALEPVERAIHLSVELGHVATERNARLLAAVTLADLGRPTEGCFHADRAMALARAAGEARGEAQVRLRMAHVHRVRHDLGAAFDQARAALDAFESLGDAGHAAIARAELGRIARRRGDAGTARAALDDAVTELEAHGERTQWLVARLDRARLARVGRAAAGEEAANHALAEAGAVRAAAEEAGMADLVASADLVIGRLLADRGELERASEAFARALQSFVDRDLPHRAIEAAAGLARCHLSAGRPAEAGALAAAHAEALARYRLLGIDDPDEVAGDLRAASAAASGERGGGG